jgi:hypothetical protein
MSSWQRGSALTVDWINEIMSSEEKKEPTGKTERQPHRIRLPGFIKEEEIGLGDVVKKVTYAMGIKPCAGCEKRAATLNRWMRFTR